MPSFQQIYNQFNSAKTQNVIGPDESISDFARKALMLTGDPSYQSVAEGGPVGNFVRSRSADLTNFINQGPVDEWLGERTKQIGDWFGISPEASRSVGERLPRMVVDFLPMMAAAPLSGGTSLIPALGMGTTSALSAASAYEDTGALGSAAIGAAAPYLGTYLAQKGGQLALKAASKSPFLNKLGFTGGTRVLNAPLSEAERGAASLAGLTEETLANTTINKTVVDRLADKGLGYFGGQVAANAGFFGLDTAYHGSEVTFNRDYLFSSLVGNLAFGLADIPRAFRPNTLPGSLSYNIPEARPQYKSPSEERAVLAAATLYDLKSPEAVEKFRKQYGLDIADVSLKTQDLRDALTVKELGLRAVDTNFVAEWNNFVNNDKLAQDAGLTPIERVGAFGSEFKGINDVVGKKDLPSKAQEIVDKFKAQRSELFRTYASAVRKLGNPVDEVRSLKYAVEDLQLDEFLKTPIEQRDYAKALEKTFLSPDGVDLIRDIHRREAGLEPLRPDLYNEFVNLYKTGTANFTADKRVELAVAASLARGEVLKFDGAKKKAQEMVNEGQKDDVVVEEALRELEKQNVSSVFKQPVIPEQTLSGLSDLGLGSTLDIRKGMPMRLNRQQEFIPEGTQSGLSDLGNPVPGEGILQQVPRKAQEEQQVVKPLNERSAEELYVSITRGAMTKQRSLDARNVIAQDVGKLSEGKKKELGKFLSEQTGSEVKPRDLVDTLLEAWTFRDDPRLFDDAFDEDVKFQKKLEKKEFKGSVYISGEDREGFALAASPDGREHVIPLPEGPRQRVAEFARGMMAKLVPAEMLPEKTEELIQLAKLFNNPELAYAELGKLVKGKSDVQFARASAGAFDFGMREVQNGKIIRPGKPPLGTKDGWMTELEFRVNGGEFGPLQKDEVAFYKQLVPEAFVNDKVHLQKLWDGLSKMGEQVKVVTYGQDGKVSVAKQEFDKLRHDWYDATSGSDKLVSRVRGGADDAILAQLGYSPADIQNAKRYLDLEYQIDNEPIIEGPRATSYYNQISPFDTKKQWIDNSGKRWNQEPIRIDAVLVGQGGRYTKPDGLHTNLNDTLGWAMVQIVPDPKTNEPVMVIAEAQSDWGQTVREKAKEATKVRDQAAEFYEDPSLNRQASYLEAEVKKLSHPLLPIHQNLILKAVIKEAQKRGIRKVAISDGETAMMTEGHDKGANWRVEGPQETGNFTSEERALRAFEEQGGKESGAKMYRLEPEQAGGMRLAYDTTLPSIMSKLVGEGQMEDFGPHKNQLFKDTRGAVERQPWQAINSRTGEVHYSRTREALERNYEQPLWEISENPAPEFVGSNKGSPVFRNPDGTPKTNVTARVYDISNPSPRADTLFAQNQGKIYGAASYKLGQILINSKAFRGQNPSDRLAFVFAHEQSHISFAKALDGKYGPQAKIQAEKALSWVTTADPQAKKAVEDVLVDLHLDKDLAQMDGVRDVLNNSDPQEWLANAMGVYAMGVVKSRKPKQAFAMLPKPLREFAEWMVQGFQTLVKGAKAWMRLSGGDYQGAKAVKDLFDTVRKSYREAEWDAIQAQKFLDIEPSSMLDQMDDVLYARAKGGVPPMSDDPKAFLGDAFNKTVQPMHTLARTHKEFVEPVMAVLKSHSDTENAVAEIYKTVAGELSSSDKVLINNPSFARVMKSEQLSKLFDAIQVHSRVNNRRMIKLVDVQNNTIGLDMDALSPQLRGRVGQFNPEAQKALVTLLAQAERANGLTQRKALEADYQQSVHRLAMILTTKSSFGKGDFHKAPEIAEGVLKDLEVGDSQNAESKLAMLDEVDRAKVMQRAGELYQQYESLKKFYDEHPTFMSFRRYGWLKQKIVKGDKTDVIDADSEKELETIVKQYLDQGWQRKGGYIREVEKRKNPQYEINQGLLKVMQDNDAAFKEMIQSEAGLSDEQKEKILSTTSTTEAMLREINGRELYRPKVGTKFSGDLERFSWWEQFQKYTPAAIAAAQKRALGAKVNFWMQNPALESLSIQKDQFMELFEQSKDADPAWARKLNKLNAAWHIGWNLPGHIAELFQPMLAGVHELVSQGESLPGAMRMFHKAEKEVGKVQAFRLKEKFFKPKEVEYIINKGKKDQEIFEGLPAVWLRANGETKENIDIARMLHAKRDRYQRAPMSEVRDFLGEDQVKLQRMMEGKPETTLSDIVTRPFHTYVKAAMGFYSQFTMHNGVVSLVTGYRKGRKMGKSHEEAMKFAELFDLTSNNSSGRLERPAMFGKLGGAGHLVYGLSSYIRGRFSQLATYYRHGFDEKQFPELTGEQRKNARKAFQTMILAQVGAAGLLGLPFVGAGIALMEELLGEDIKGKMINALDEVTNDPMLTRVFTHGMGATLTESLGIPADMHSRFALSSFLGTNAYDGMSAKSFMGPSVAMFSSMFNLAGQVMQGDKMEKALSVSGPGGVKRLVEALGEDFQRDNPEANLAMSMLGFRSSQMVKRKEWEQITRKQELEARRNLEKSALNVSNALQVSPLEGRKALLVEADNLLPQGMDYQEQIKQRQQNVKDLIQKVSELEANRVGPQDVRRLMPGRIAPVASQTAQSMGVQMTNPMEVARALAQQQTRSQLGATMSQRPVRNALLQEMQWGQNPWSF